MLKILQAETKIRQVDVLFQRVSNREVCYVTGIQPLASPEVFVCGENQSGNVKISSASGDDRLVKKFEFTTIGLRKYRITKLYILKQQPFEHVYKRWRFHFRETIFKQIIINHDMDARTFYKIVAILRIIVDCSCSLNYNNSITCHWFKSQQTIVCVAI